MIRGTEFRLEIHPRAGLGWIPYYILILEPTRKTINNFKIQICKHLIICIDDGYFKVISNRFKVRLNQGYLVYSYNFMGFSTSRMYVSTEGRRIAFGIENIFNRVPKTAG